MKRSLLYQIGSAETLEFDAVVEEVQLAETLGIDTAWCFPAAGVDGKFRDSAPLIWLSGIAARTQRIRLGWGLAGMTPPSRPPMRMAEQASSIDLASEGRLDIAFLPDADLAHEGAPAWDEGVRMSVKMWSADTFSWNSARFTVQPVDVLPKPVQLPHPPIWLAGWSVDHATRAGEGGLAFLDISGAADETLVLSREAYAEARAGADPNDLVSAGIYGVAVDLETSPAGIERLIRLEELGFDEVVVRAGCFEAGSTRASEQIQFLASEAGRSQRS